MLEYNYNDAWNNIYGDIQQFGPTHKHLRRIISKILKTIEYESFVDVGCGSGMNFAFLTKGKNIRRIVGIDISEKALNEAKKHRNAELLTMDIQKEYLDDRFDLVFSSLLLEHVPDDQTVLEHLHKMTGHYLLIATMGGNYDKYRIWEEKMGHVRNYSVPELKNKLEKAGFKIKQYIKWGFPFYSPLIRQMLNVRPEAGIGKYSFIARAGATLLYWLCFLNRHNRGDLLVILAEV